MSLVDWWKNFKESTSLHKFLSCFDQLSANVTSDDRRWNSDNVDPENSPICNLAEFGKSWIKRKLVTDWDWKCIAFCFHTFNNAITKHIMGFYTLPASDDWMRHSKFVSMIINLCISWSSYPIIISYVICVVFYLPPHGLSDCATWFEYNSYNIYPLNCDSIWYIFRLLSE